MSEAPSPSLYRPDAFSGRVCCVTGGAHGIGEATVRQLAHLGASVVVLDVDPDNLARIRTDLEQANVSSLCLRGDIANSSVLEDAVVQIEAKWGRLDGWVNNAATPAPGLLQDQSVSDFQHALNLNLVTPWRAIQLAAPLMQKTGGGSILNVGSVLAHRTVAGKAAYTSSKAGLEGLTRALAVELGQYHIRVNSIVPGTIVTRDSKLSGRVPDHASEEQRSAARRARQGVLRDRQPWPQWGTPKDVANVIVFMLSEMSAFVNGATLAVDGGSLADAHHLERPERLETASDYNAYLNMLAKE